MTSESTINAGHQIIVNEEKSDESLSEDDERQDDDVKELRRRGHPVGAKNRTYEKVDRPLRSNAQVLIISEPQSYEEAISCEEAPHWIGP